MPDADGRFRLTRPYSRGLKVPDEVAPGRYSLVLVVDQGNVVKETNESNGRREIPITVTAADLVLTGEGRFDSQSLEILARIADRGVAERDSSSWRNDAITNRQAAKRLFQDWARRLGDALESAQSLASPDSTEAEVEAEPR